MERESIITMLQKFISNAPFLCFPPQAPSLENTTRWIRVASSFASIQDARPMAVSINAHPEKLMHVFFFNSVIITYKCPSIRAHLIVYETQSVGGLPPLVHLWPLWSLSWSL